MTAWARSAARRARSCKPSPRNARGFTRQLKSCPASAPTPARRTSCSSRSRPAPSQRLRDAPDRRAPDERPRPRRGTHPRSRCATTRPRTGSSRRSHREDRARASSRDCRSRRPPTRTSTARRPFFPLVGLLVGALAAARPSARRPGPAAAARDAARHHRRAARHRRACTRTASPTSPTPSAPTRPSERRLEILKDPRVGTFGALALIVAVAPHRRPAIAALDTEHAVTRADRRARARALGDPAGLARCSRPPSPAAPARCCASRTVPALIAHRARRWRIAIARGDAARAAPRRSRPPRSAAIVLHTTARRHHRRRLRRDRQARRGGGRLTLSHRGHDVEYDPAGQREARGSRWDSGAVAPL